MKIIKIKKRTNHTFGRSAAISILAAAVLVACVAEEESDEQYFAGDNINGLKVSLGDYRFGVQEVGSSTPQIIELRNVGVDTFPINAVSITGENADDFIVTADEGVTLEPGDRLELNVAFEPVGEGQRLGALEIDYSTIEGVGSNAVEALFYNARDLEDSGDHVAAKEEYRRYIGEGSTTDNKARAMIKLTLLDEADVYGVGKDFNLYKSALNMRDEGDIDGAIYALETLIADQNDSYLIDDAKYMLGYIQLVDQSDYAASLLAMQSVIDNHPDSSYYDTALYSQGLAEYELGNIERAEEIFLSLRDRHTGVQLGLFEARWPKDNYVSRLWFDRADEQLVAIENETTNDS